MVIIRVQQSNIEWNKHKIGLNVGKTRTNVVKNSMFLFLDFIFSDNLVLPSNFLKVYLIKELSIETEA